MNRHFGVFATKMPFLLFQTICRRLSSTSMNIPMQMKQLNERKEFAKAISLFDKHVQHAKATVTMINEVLKACVALSDFKRGAEIHQNLSHQLMENPSVRINLIRFYMKHGDIQKAQEIFRQSTNKTHFLYNTLLNGLAANNRAEEALELVRDMPIPPDQYILSSVFKICAQLGDARSIQFGRSLLDTVPSAYQNDTVLWNSALHMLMKVGEISRSEQIFARMKKDASSYRMMIAGYVLNNRPQQAIDLFFQTKEKEGFTYVSFLNACAQLKTEKALNLGKQILAELSSKSFPKKSMNEIFRAALDMFIKCNDIKSAELLFAGIERDVVCYGSLMKAYNMNGQSSKTLSLFERMKTEKVEPNEIIFTLVINALGQLGDLTTCESMIVQLPISTVGNLWIQNTLIDMWGKAGSVSKAKQVFEKMTKLDAISYAAMIHAYGLNGMGVEAVKLFHQRPLRMEAESIYVTVLTACSHSGLVEEAQQIFATIPAEARTSRVYGAMIDALSRSNLVDEAQSLLNEYEKEHAPCSLMYMSILSAARNLRNTLLAQKMFDQVRCRFSDDKEYMISAMVLLGNTYGRTGDFSETSKIRMQINQSGLKKVPGLSTTIVNSQIVQFEAHDRSHSRSNEIYAEMDSWTEELTKRGYTPDASWLTRPLINDESVASVLCGHSERLAIAFNLIQKPRPTRIQLTKNLRVCGDCHEVTKLVAQIRQCEIIVRDARRIHHFSPNGQCSCRDQF